MFHPIVFHLHTTKPNQRNVSAPWLIQNMLAVPEAPQAGSLHSGQGQPAVLGSHNAKLPGCGTGEGFTDPTTMQTPNNLAVVPWGPIVLSSRHKNIRAAVTIFPKRHRVYNPTLPFWHISPVIIQYKIMWSDQATPFDQDRPGILMLS